MGARGERVGFLSGAAFGVEIYRFEVFLAIDLDEVADALLSKVL